MKAFDRWKATPEVKQDLITSTVRSNSRIRSVAGRRKAEQRANTPNITTTLVTTYHGGQESEQIWIKKRRLS